MGGCASLKLNQVLPGTARTKDKLLSSPNTTDFEKSFAQRLELLCCRVNDVVSDWYSVNEYFSQKSEIILEKCEIYHNQAMVLTKETIMNQMKSQANWKSKVEELVLVIGRADSELQNIEQRLSDLSYEVEELNDNGIQTLRAQKSKLLYKIEKAKQIGPLHNNLADWDSIIKTQLDFTYNDLKMRKRNSKKLTYISPVEYQRKGQQRSTTISLQTQQRNPSIIPINSNRTPTNRNTNHKYNNSSNNQTFQTANKTNSSQNFSFQAF